MVVHEGNRRVKQQRSQANRLRNPGRMTWMEEALKLFNRCREIVAARAFLCSGVCIYIDACCCPINATIEDQRGSNRRTRVTSCRIHANDSLHSLLLLFDLQGYHRRGLTVGHHSQQETVCVARPALSDVDRSDFWPFHALCQIIGPRQMSRLRRYDYSGSNRVVHITRSVWLLIELLPFGLTASYPLSPKSSSVVDPGTPL
jgi:hypothetical protein